VLIPLALDGHTVVVGLDRARGMLARAEAKARALAPEVRERTTLLRRDLLREAWPAGFDPVIMGAIASTSWRRRRNRPGHHLGGECPAVREYVQ